MEPYYYTKMSKPQQAVYYAIYQGLMALSDSFQVPKLEGRELSDVFFQLRLDHPEIFWAEGFHYRYYQDSANITFLPEYIFEKGKIKEHQKALKARVEKLVRPAMKLSEWEKEKYVHDFICENIRYDKLKKSYSHEIIGPLGQGVGVCEGIAKAVKVLLDALGVWCVIAICGNNPETSEIRYDYFNLDDKKIFRDHEPLIAPAPVCTNGDHFYYREKKLSFTKEEDVYKRSLQAAKKGRTLTFQWRGGYLTREVLEKLLDLLRKAGEEKQKAARISLNWSQAVIRVSYVEDIGLACVDMEEANEGEKE